LLEYQASFTCPKGEEFMADINEQLAFIDNPLAPEVFADGATGFFILGSNVRITFGSLRCNHATSPGPVSRVVIGRLTMSLDGAESLARGLLDFIEKQRAQQNAPTQASTRH
jgi:hypothetical protein